MPKTPAEKKAATAAKKNKAPKPTQRVQRINRRTSDSQDGWTDLFKLTVATGKKFIGWLFEDSKDHWEDMEHAHHFYTVDKKGGFSKYSSPNANHFHAVTVVRDKDSKMVLDKQGQPQAQVGPALTVVSFKEGKVKKTRIERVKLFDRDGEPVFDEHTHDAVYLKSGKARLKSTMSATAAVAMSEVLVQINSREPQPPSGVQIQ